MTENVCEETGYIRGDSGGYYNSLGYPVTPEGRPDWCATCAKLEDHVRRNKPDWRPSRVEYARLEAGGRVTIMQLGLCEECGRRDRESRENAKSAAVSQNGRGR